MSRTVIWSAMIFLIFSLATLVRADVPPESPASRAVPAPESPIAANDAEHGAVLKLAAASPESPQDRIRSSLTTVDSPRPAAVPHLTATVTPNNDWQWQSLSYVPEPASLALVAIGGVLMWGQLRRRA